MKTTIPERGMTRGAILAALTDLRRQDLPSDGHAFAFVYDPGEEAQSIAREAFAACMGINGLDPTVYPSARGIENAIVQACLELVRAPAGAAGTATAGGTESVMLAVKAARDNARRSRPEIKHPRMLVPETAHACFHKAAAYLGVELVRVDVDDTFRASVEDARRKMTRDVILVVGSAPSYAHGVVDPIPELAALAREHGAFMHVDACVGGWVLPFLRESGVPVPAFDFDVPGVTSLSLDLHKYGFAPKGVSALLMRDRSLRDAHYFACARWSGYSIVNSTTLGSKSVAAMGAALAVMQHLGREGYTRHAQQMWEATLLLCDAVEQTPGLRLLARPDMNLFAFTTSAAGKQRAGDLFELSDRLLARGWHVQPTYSFGRSPAHIHLTLDPGNAAHAAAFAADLRNAARDLPPQTPPPAPLLAALESLVSGNATGSKMNTHMLMGALGIKDGQMPARAAGIHRLLDAASPDVREALLVSFVGELFTQPEETPHGSP
ncbi:MAG: aspartate aminotransferase family protein [Sandaracinaceae bacterium]|nr:aspartate aminotransferase family protein [Sandaracinaceae bacterium]